MSIHIDTFNEDTENVWKEFTVDFCNAYAKKPAKNYPFKMVMKFITYTSGYLQLDDFGN